MIKSQIYKCRLCNEPLKNSFVNLGMQPICENYLSYEEINQKEIFYQLQVYFCNKCLLVQQKDFVLPNDLFNEYSYFSSHSKDWLRHAQSYADMIIGKLNLKSDSQVIEIGSNDGYLLQFFSKKNIPVLGIDPATNVATEANSKGITTIIAYFDKKISEKIKTNYGKADLIIGNNVLAQVPDLHGFVEGLKNLLKPSGIITIEFHHLMNLINKNQFDKINHEQFSYFSFFVAEKLFSMHDLTIFNVEEISTHGGSLRIYIRHTSDKSKSITSKVRELKNKEIDSGLKRIETYISFEEKVKEIKRKILSLLIKYKQEKKMIAGYGAHAEAHTFLNYCGIDLDFLDYTVDRNPIKQGKFIAGNHIPILNPTEINRTKPDFVLILPWHIKKEIISQMEHVGKWGGQFIVSIPDVILYNANGTEINN